MGVIEEHWSRWEHPITYGIFFPDDTCIAMHGLELVGGRVPISISATGWVDMDPEPLCDGPLVVLGGESSWEGTGLLVVCDDKGRLQWMLHCENSEPFVNAEVNGAQIEAVSECYPFRYVWSFPLMAPWEYKVSERKL